MKLCRSLRVKPIVGILLCIVMPCMADLGDALAPLEKPDIVSARRALKNLEAYAKTLNGKDKEEVVNLASAIKNLYTTDYRVTNALKNRVEMEKEARKHDKSARDWMEPTAHAPEGRPQHARTSVLKAEKVRKNALVRLERAQQALRNDMVKIDTLIEEYYEAWDAEPCLILTKTMCAINERSLSSEPFEPTINKESIEELRMFLANLDRYLSDAKAAETAKNHEKAFRLYTKARNIAGRRRNASELAKSLEAEKLYGSACEYYEIAGKFDDAVRVRKEHPEMLESSFAKLSSEGLYAKMAPCCVRVRNAKGHGTGFFFKRGGYILTNNHVIDGAEDLEVVAGLGKSYEVKVLAKSTTSDLAVIKIELDDHEVAKLGDAELVKIGTKAALIGFPQIDAPTATMNAGLISNTDRVIRNIPCYQLDISTNPGNSGGPVLTERGRVIGVHAMGIKATRIDRFSFAIRVDVVKKFILEKMGKDFAEN